MPEVHLTKQMSEAFASAIPDGRPALVATASASGMPDLAYKGSLMVLDDDHLAFWERAHGTTLQNLRQNPQASALYWNPTARISWKFFGVAELLTAGARRMEIMGRTVQIELDRDPERKGVAVVIRIDKVIQLGQVVMERGSGG